MMYGVLCMVHCVWCMVHGVWCMGHGVWCMVYGAWCRLYGVWCMCQECTMDASSDDPGIDRSLAHVEDTMLKK